MEGLPTAREIALGALHISRLLGWLFLPYGILVTAAVFLLKGKNVAEVRIRLAVFTGGVVVGMLLCTMWLMTGFRFTGAAYAVGAADPRHSRTAVLLTGPLLWRIVPVSVAVSAHALVHLVAGLRAAPRTCRNKVAFLFIATAVWLALYSLFPQVRFWRRLYNREAMAASRDALLEISTSTDELTKQWADDHPDDWGMLLLRANLLHESGRFEEAKDVDETILRLPGDSLPKGLKPWIERRLTHWRLNSGPLPRKTRNGRASILDGATKRSDVRGQADRH
jgi:hypothetical protein